VEQGNFNERNALGQECIGENSKVNFWFPSTRKKYSNYILLEEDCTTKQDFAALGTELVTPSAASTCSRVGHFPQKEYISSKTWGIGMGGGEMLSDKRP
jgi:hypothetical protein